MGRLGEGGFGWGEGCEVNDWVCRRAMGVAWAWRFLMERRDNAIIFL